MIQRLKNGSVWRETLSQSIAPPTLSKPNWLAIWPAPTGRLEIVWLHAKFGFLRRPALLWRLWGFGPDFSMLSLEGEFPCCSCYP